MYKDDYKADLISSHLQLQVRYVKVVTAEVGSVRCRGMKDF